MAGFYKVSILGTAAGQDITNILYYSAGTPDTLTWDAGVAADLGQSVLDAWIEQIVALMPNAYTLTGADVSMVNEDGEVTSPYTVSVADTAVGAQGGAIATAGMCAIVKFNCEPATLLNTHPVPKRSYIAVGPLSEAQVDPDGTLTVQAAYQTAATPAFTQGHLIGLQEFEPYRVGRTVGIVPAGVGKVVGAVVRPFSSFRRSRLRAPSGS